MNFLFTIVCLFINLCIYLSMRKSGEYRGGKMFLVSIPEWESRDTQVQEINQQFRKEFRIVLWINTGLALTRLILPNMWLLLYSLLIFVMLMLYEFPLRKANRLMKELKKERSWPIVNGSQKLIDITIAAHMKESIVRPIWYVIPFLIALSAYLMSPKRSFIINGYLLLIAVIPACLYVTIRRLPNHTYCEDSVLNIRLNRNRRRTFSLVLLILACGDALMFTLISVLTADGPIWLVFVLLFFAVVTVLSSLWIFYHYHCSRQEIIRTIKNPIRYDDEDDYWKYGWIAGPCYNNPNDPEVFKDNGSDSSMTLNSGRPSVKIFYSAVVLGLSCLMIGIFAYPAVLDYQHKLVDVSITGKKVKIDSPFYGKEIPLASIQKVELRQKLGNMTRVGGTDTGIYATGNYETDAFGRVKMYIASRHKQFIIAYTSDGIIIFNDDDTGETSKLYQALDQLCRERE